MFKRLGTIQTTDSRKTTFSKQETKRDSKIRDSRFNKIQTIAPRGKMQDAGK